MMACGDILCIGGLVLACLACVWRMCAHLCVRACVRACVYFFFVLAHEPAKHALRLVASGGEAKEKKETREGKTKGRGGREREREKGISREE